MLQFYYHPLSPLARRVWLALLEKKLNFEPIIVNLDRGEQLKPEFLQLNPFHHVPVLVDDDIKVIESLAILDYLECKYPEISLLPNDAAILAKVKMVQMVANHELGSQIIPLILDDSKSIKTAKAKRHLKRICQFFSDILEDNLFFGGKEFTVGDIVVGNSLLLINKLGFDFEQFPSLDSYCQRLMERDIWQKVQPNQEQIELWKQVVRNLLINRSE
jgi:glutathione S-transferase